MTKRNDFLELSLNEFQARCTDTAVYRQSIRQLLLPVLAGINSVDYEVIKKAELQLQKLEDLLCKIYTVIGAAGEIGEVANEMQKMIRDGKTDETKLLEEIGDSQYFLNAALTEFRTSANDCAINTLTKLKKRKDSNIIKGEH